MLEFLNSATDLTWQKTFFSGFIPASIVNSQVLQQGNKQASIKLFSPMDSLGRPAPY